MFRFFRTLRQRLLTENRFRNYFLYALGEIFLVVIGILIALQVNTWNDDRKERVQEQRLLAALEDEVSTNLGLLRNQVEIAKNDHEASLRLSEFTGPEPVLPPERELAQILVDAFKLYPSFSPNLGVLTESINSGSLSLIQDMGLRTELASMEAKIQQINAQEGFVVQMNNKTQQFFLDYGNFRKHMTQISRNPRYTPGHFPNEPERFLSLPAFENHLFLYLGALSLLQEKYAVMEADLLQTLEHLKAAQQQ
jgi:hypothetical protein